MRVHEDKKKISEAARQRWLAEIQEVRGGTQVVFVVVCRRSVYSKRSCLNFPGGVMVFLEGQGVLHLPAVRVVLPSIVGLLQP